MRTAFIEELIRQARTNPAVFLVVGDLGYSVVEPFAREFPDRFLNAGVAEQNMTGVAAGLASEGYHVFTYSIANFPTFRCAEQIRNDVVYHHLPVTVAAVGGGLAYGNLGYSHHAVQDIALMRSFPGLMLACPGDPAETRACVRQLCAHPRPSYLRLGKAGEPAVHPAEVAVSPGQILCVLPGGDRIGILCTAASLKLAHSVASRPEFAGRVGVHSLPLWNESCRAAVVEFVNRFARVVTLEDHLRAGGFGSFVMECLDRSPALLSRLTVVALDPSVCGEVASQQTLNAIGGLTAAKLADLLGTML